MSEPGTVGADLKKPRAGRRGSAPALPSADRLPPHSLEAERGVLGCILLSPNPCMGESLELLKGQPEVFYDPRHQIIYRTLIEMFEQREPIDLITLQQRLKDAPPWDDGRHGTPVNRLEMAGGLAYLASLPDAVPSAANLAYYANIVYEKYLLRRLIQTCTGVIGRVFEYEGNVEELLDEVERDILRISEERVEGGTIPIRDLVREAISTIEKLYTQKGMLSGLPTGFPDLDRLTTGLHGGEMIVIAARPSVGKTSLAMNIAEHVAVDLRLPVAVFSLEMTAASLAMRLLCSRARVNLRNLREGFLAERDFPKLTTAAGKLAGAPLYIDDTSGLSILQLRARARRMAQQHGIRLFVIDYLQLLHSTSRRAENRQQEIADISNGVKALAKELNVPVIVLSQLNRDVEKRGAGEAPRLSDLRESGAIEQDADVVALLYRDTKGREEDDPARDFDQEAIPVKLYIAKQRNGPTGEIDLVFLRPYTRFESVAKVEAEDLPPAP
ncbi:replicative DNA helicase [Limisphaera ngatamarikiensis]|uniref:Replicative DNA helicase n=1 Tax=Limisphaera ngatamarikiensis TaxID=1324935 RepID=A0A6M1RTB5_9BACT|nr:replicative DNA helicase [Limisphaera ngatamarikiensis]NGO38621.1 replicative DNA helicase [Limisphaera ngatamarikiensis]